MRVTLEETMTIGDMPDQGYPRVMHFTVAELKETFPAFTDDELVELLRLAYDYYVNVGVNGGYTKLYYIDFQFIDIKLIKATLYGRKHALFNTEKKDCVKYKQFYDSMLIMHPELEN